MDNIALLETLLMVCVDKKITPMLWGRHGIGKSTIIRQLFEKLGYKVVDLRLGQLEVGDLIGMPSIEYFCPVCNSNYGVASTMVFCPKCKADGQSVHIVGQTVWLAPSWFPQNGEKCLFFFDELNRGRLDVQQAAFQIVLDGKIHTHVIPDNCAVVCASNPSGGEGDVDYNVEPIDPALLDRFCNIKFNLDTKQWLAWARDNNIIEPIIAFIGADSKALGAENIDMKLELRPSPRSYEFLSKILGDERIERKYWTEVAACILGESTAMQFTASLKNEIEQPLTPKEIFDHFNKAGVQERLSWQIDEDNARFDLLRVTCDAIKHYTDDPDKCKRLKEKQLNNLGDFILVLPKDLGFATIKDLSNNQDITQRMLLPRKDMFKLLKEVREGVNGAN